MRIHSRTVWQWSEARKQYVKIIDEFYDYSGPVALTCGASAQQTQIEAAQQSFYTQLQSQATAAFGAASGVFQGLMATFAPIVAAGPSQQGFSQQENANLNSQAITQTGNAYQNAKAAVGNAEAAEGGGNVDLPSGAAVGTDLGLAESAANQTASEESQITQANYAQGNKNYEEAVAGEEAAPGVFSTSSGAANAATEGGNAASNTANQIAQENNSWVNAAIGALGGIAGSAVGGWAKGLGSNQNAPTPTDAQAGGSYA
jgi:hypothetical protein